ncbi:uncharacterized protein LOC129561673 [Moschus berezovskii]|uniref:uncharacterized protein LOC129561673 n=1 Tax=Moschus berezovskii TaxID=68408 RepID=UPI002443B44E|nr:uncharacterized protein LOC129561673 [Moschus berezovskii]
MEIDSGERRKEEQAGFQLTFPSAAWGSQSGSTPAVLTPVAESSNSLGCPSSNRPPPPSYRPPSPPGNCLHFLESWKLKKEFPIHVSSNRNYGGLPLKEQKLEASIELPCLHVLSHADGTELIKSWVQSPLCKGKGPASDSPTPDANTFMCLDKASNPVRRILEADQPIEGSCEPQMRATYRILDFLVATFYKVKTSRFSYSNMRVGL